MGVGILYAAPEVRYEFLAGSWERARQIAEDRVAENRGTTNRTVLTFLLFMLGDVLRAQGMLEEAKASYEEASTTEIARPWWGDWGVVARLNLGEVDAMLGNLEAARAHLAGGEAQLAGSTGARGLVGYLERTRAGIAAAENRHDDADSAYQSAVEAFERHGFPFEQAATLHAWGRALLNAGEPSRAVEKLDAARSIYLERGAGPQWAQAVLDDRVRAQR
jgi:tetratricopeptide (TPR) repeat protein